MELLKRVFTGEIKGIDEKERTLTAYISTGARDRMDEVLTPAGVDLRAYKKNPVVLWAHNYQQPPIGKALWVKKDGEGIVSKVKFANTEFAQEVFDLYKEGYMRAFSVGFIPKEHEDGDGKKSPRRTYTKWEMLEYSAVPVPANPEALTLAIQKGVLKSDKLKEQLLPEAEEVEVEGVETKPKFKCEGIDCGHKVTTDKHCKDIKCSKCGGTMRRAERPGPGQASAEEVTESSGPSVTVTPNPELLEQVKAMRIENAQLKNKVLELRYELLQEKKVEKVKNFSEMSDDEILSKIEENVIRVIRKVTGKVN